MRYRNHNWRRNIVGKRYCPFGRLINDLSTLGPLILNCWRKTSPRRGPWDRCPGSLFRFSLLKSVTDFGMGEWLPGWPDAVRRWSSHQSKRPGVAFCEFVLQLNYHLEDKIYIAGNCLTFADLMIFVELYPVAVSLSLYLSLFSFGLCFQEMLPAAQYNQFCNFLRWHDFIQGLIKCDELLPPIKRKIPVFDFRPPSKATSKKVKRNFWFWILICVFRTKRKREKESTRNQMDRRRDP